MKSIIVDENGILGRLYRLCLWDGWSFEAYYMRRQTNLCHFMRTVFLWLPLKFTVVLMTLGFLLTAALAPLFVFGLFAYLMIVAAGVLTAWTIIKLIQENGVTMPDWAHSEGVVLFLAWVRAKKESICPLIELRRKDG